MATFDNRGQRIVETQWVQTSSKLQHACSMAASHAWRLRAFAHESDVPVISSIITHVREIERLILELPSGAKIRDDKGSAPKPPLTPSY